MNRDEEFEKWYDEYFGNAQGEDSPYTYNDIKIAFFKGFKIAKENLTKDNSQKNQSAIRTCVYGCGEFDDLMEHYRDLHTKGEFAKKLRKEIAD